MNKKLKIGKKQQLVHKSTCNKNKSFVSYSEVGKKSENVDLEKSSDKSQTLNQTEETF